MTGTDREIGVGDPGPSSVSAVRDETGRRLVMQCLAGDAGARVDFQQQFGPLIYRIANHLGPSGFEGGDLYIYLFDDDRIYKRLGSYRGDAKLALYLQNFVLPSMLRQFLAQSRQRELETTSLDSEPTQRSGYWLRETLPSPEQRRANVVQGQIDSLIDHLAADRRLLLKLLYIEDFDLTPTEIQHISEQTGRTIRETISRIEMARMSVRDRQAAQQARLDEAESAASWILAYDRQLAQIGSSNSQQSTDDVPADLARKRAWRERQRDRALFEAEKASVTLRYREIAEILDSSVGSISAQVVRLRRELRGLRERVVAPRAVGEC